MGLIPAPVRFAGYIMHQDFWMSSAVFLNSSNRSVSNGECAGFCVNASRVS